MRKRSAHGMPHPMYVTHVIGHTSTARPCMLYLYLYMYTARCTVPWYVRTTYGFMHLLMHTADQTDIIIVHGGAGQRGSCEVIDVLEQPSLRASGGGVRPLVSPLAARAPGGRHK